MTTITISIITNICVNSSDRSSTTTTIVVVIVGIKTSSLPQIIVLRTSARTNAASCTTTAFILFTSIRFNTIASTSTSSTTIMITLIVSTISVTVAVTITLPSIIVSTHIIMIYTIVAVIVTLISKCIMNVTVATARNIGSISIPAPVLLLSLLL